METIYEKLNIESNKTSLEPTINQKHHNQKLLVQANSVPSSLEQYQPIEKRMEFNNHSPTKSGIDFEL